MSRLAFGALLSLMPLVLGTGLADAEATDAESVALGILLGVLMTALATDMPFQAIVVLNPIRLPLIFVTGVFVSLSAMPDWGRSPAPFPPLFSSADLNRVGLGRRRPFSAEASVMAQLDLGAGFMVLARLLRRSSQSRSR